MADSRRAKSKVTIGLPFADQPLAEFSAAIQSVFAQTYQDWTLILVCDGASGECLDFARSIADPRVHVEEFGKREGLARRLNDIAAMSETPFLFRMDADDIMHPQRIARQLTILESDCADLVGSRAYLIDGCNHIYGLMRESPELPTAPHSYLANRPILMHPTLAATTEWFRTHPYDDTLLRAQDKALFINAVSSTRMVKMKEPLLFYRVAKPISPRRQAVSYGFDRVVVRKYGRLIASRPRVLGYVAKSHVKQRLFQLMTLLGAQDQLFDRKIDPLDSASIAEAEAALTVATASRVPISQAY